jgi:hypothetical protein
VDEWAVFWSGAEAVGTWIGVAVAGVAAAFAIKYAHAADRILRLEHTPAVRMTRRVGGDTGVIFKNVGRGPAIGVFLTNSQHEIIRLRDAKGFYRNSLDVLDPPTGGPLKERLGRYPTACETALRRTDGDAYHIYYQDFDARWYLTKNTWLEMTSSRSSVVSNS